MKQTFLHHLGARARVTRNLHYLLLFILALFTLAALVVGEMMNAYVAIWWWDDMLHGISGVIIGFLGLLAIYFFNARHVLAVRPVFVAVFVFCFAMTISVVWEMFEFAMDFTFQTNMQRWHMALGSIVIGKEYQGLGLRDTMSDLIVASLGAALAAVVSYFAYKQNRPVVLDIMRRTFPWIRRRK